MNTSVEKESGGALDVIKWLFVLALIGAGAFGNSYYSDESLLYRVLALLGLAVVAGAVAFTTVRGAAFAGLIKASRAEIRKVVWPTNQETNQTTLIVLGVVVLTGIILWGIDSLLSFIVSKIIG